MIPKRGFKEERPMSDASNRGFASMDEERQREIASEGDQAAHEQGTAHEFTPEEAREAGRNEELGPEGYSELGQQGGEARSEQ